MPVDPAQVRALLMEFERPLHAWEIADLLDCPDDFPIVTALWALEKAGEAELIKADVRGIVRNRGWRLCRETGVSP